MVNREGTGLCPMESKLLNAKTAEECVTILRGGQAIGRQMLDMLNEQGLSLLVYSHGTLTTHDNRGVQDLVQLISDHPERLEGAIVADKVIGKAAAALMATGGVGAIILLIANFMGMPNQIGGALQNVITRVASFVGDLVNRFTSGARQSVSNFMNQISSLPGKFIAELNRMLSAVNEWAATLPAKFWEAGVNAVKNFLNALGIHSPGYMQLALIGEMKNTTLGIVSEGKQLVSNLASIGYNAVKSWGNPELTYGYVNVNNMNAVSGSNASNGNIESLLNRIIELLAALTIVNNINYNHYGDINSDEKMQEILEYIRKYLYFNNDTAGRTV